MLAVKALQLLAAWFPALSAIGSAEDVLIGGDKDRVTDSCQCLGIQRGKAAVGKRPVAAVVVADADAPAGGRVSGAIVAEKEPDILAARTGQQLQLCEERCGEQEKEEEDKVFHGYLLLAQKYKKMGKADTFSPAAYSIRANQRHQRAFFLPQMSQMLHIHPIAQADSLLLFGKLIFSNST